MPANHRKELDKLKPECDKGGRPHDIDAAKYNYHLMAKYFKQQVPRGRAPLVQRTVLRLHFDLHVLIASLARRVKTPPGWQTDERHELKKEKDDFELEKTAVAAGEQYSLQDGAACCLRGSPVVAVLAQLTFCVAAARQADEGCVARLNCFVHEKLKP